MPGVLVEFVDDSPEVVVEFSETYAAGPPGPQGPPGPPGPATGPVVVTDNNIGGLATVSGGPIDNGFGGIAL